MVDMVERVARALWADQVRVARQWDTPVEQVEAWILKGPYGHELDKFMPMARVAIEAMREPSEEMRRVMVAVGVPPNVHNRFMRELIDAAIKKTPA